MAVKHGPKGAIPTLRGWIDPKTGELLKSQLFTQEQLDAYNGVQMIAEPSPVIERLFIETEPEQEMELIVDAEPKLIEEEPAPKPKKKKKKRSVTNLFG
jgi:hypothetical protein